MTSIFSKESLTRLMVDLAKSEETAGACCLRFPGHQVSETVSTSRWKTSMKLSQEM